MDINVLVSDCLKNVLRKSAKISYGRSKIETKKCREAKQTRNKIQNHFLQKNKMIQKYKNILLNQFYMLLKSLLHLKMYKIYFKENIIALDCINLLKTFLFAYFVTSKKM